MLRVSDVGETTNPISKIASRGHAKNMTNARKATLTEAATTAQQRIVAGENSRASCEVSTHSGGIQVSSKDRVKRQTCISAETTHSAKAEPFARRALAAPPTELAKRHPAWRAGAHRLSLAELPDPSARRAGAIRECEEHRWKGPCRSHAREPAKSVPTGSASCRELVRSARRLRDRWPGRGSMTSVLRSTRYPDRF